MRRLSVIFAFVFFVIFSGNINASVPFNSSGSCSGFCGGKSNSSCWCDSACSGYGDCCSDYVPACLAPPPSSQHKFYTISEVAKASNNTYFRLDIHHPPNSLYERIEVSISPPGNSYIKNIIPIPVEDSHKEVFNDLALMLAGELVAELVAELLPGPSPMFYIDFLETLERLHNINKAKPLSLVFSCTGFHGNLCFLDKAALLIHVSQLSSNSKEGIQCMGSVKGSFKQPQQTPSSLMSFYSICD